MGNGYVDRTIRFDKKSLSAQGFFKNDGPLVLLGESGAGKTELLKYANMFIKDSEFYDARTILSGIEFESNTNVIIVDAIDEVTTYNSHDTTTISRILEKVPRKYRLILSCRAAEWDQDDNDIIEKKWKHKVAVGRIEPMTDSQIIHFIVKNHSDVDANEFLREASEHEVLELIRNPLNLILFLKIANDAWPDSKKALYDRAIKKLSCEKNVRHRKSQTQNNYPYEEELLEKAGYIATVILLSGKMGISRSDNDNYITISDLTTIDINECIIEKALSTRLFEASGDNCFRITHRTIAEYLSALWLAEQLSSERRTITPTKIQNVILHGNEAKRVVPEGYRGLYAWLATLCEQCRNTFIKYDPHSILRYGDVTEFDSTRISQFIDYLKKSFEDNPWQIGQDWYMSYSKGLIRDETKESIIKIINRSILMPQLSYLVLKSISHTNYTPDIESALIDLISNTRVESYLRNEASRRLRINSGQKIIDIVDRLITFGDLESEKIALILMANNTDLFGGSKIAELIVDLELNEKLNGSIYYLVDMYDIDQRLSLSQLQEAIQILSTGKNGISNGSFHIQWWLCRFIQATLKPEHNLEPSKIWHNLQHLISCNKVRGWEQHCKEYFKNHNVRYAIQHHAVITADDPRTIWTNLCHMSDISISLTVTKEDIIRHTDDLMANRANYKDWEERWIELVRFGRRFIKDQEFIHHIDHQSKEEPGLVELHNNLINNENTQINEIRKYESRTDKEKIANRISRYQDYKDHIDKLKSGKIFQEIIWITQAYLGELKAQQEYEGMKYDDENLINNILWLVGKEMYPHAKEAIISIVNTNNIADIRELCKRWIKKEVSEKYGKILLTYCHMVYNEEKTLLNLPLEIRISALAFLCFGVFHYPIHYPIFTAMQRELEYPSKNHRIHGKLLG